MLCGTVQSVSCACADCEAVKAQALANVENAFKDQEDRRGTYDSCVHQDSDLQHSCEPPLPSQHLSTHTHTSPPS